ncbi:MAG TPA: penicillin-binding protein activator LpoB [Longimicrobiaceae bacterium]|nr:penicillin-binding protein activator LpoB [Longimicrobiaceae bacterium]
MKRAPMLAARMLTAALAVSALSACAPRITRVAPEQAIDLSGRWNDVDSRMVAEALIHQSFAEPAQNWATKYATRHGGEPPTVIVGTIRNRSMEHVPVGTFVADLERAYINSGLVKVVSSKGERDEVRDERQDQQEYATAATRAQLHAETGADYMLQGEIQSIEDREGGRSVVFYQVDLTLTNLQTNEKVWVGQHKIKKFIDRSRFGF